MHIIEVIIAFGRDSVITTFPLPLLDWSLWLSKFSFMFLLCFSTINITAAKLLYFLKQHPDRSFLLALSPLSTSGLLLAEFLNCTCVQGIIKAAAHGQLSGYDARKSHITWGLDCVQLHRDTFIHLHTVSTKMWNIISAEFWVLRIIHSFATFLSIINSAAGRYDGGKVRFSCSEFFFNILFLHDIWVMWKAHQDPSEKYQTPNLPSVLFNRTLALELMSMILILP